MAGYPFPPRIGSSIIACNQMKHLSKKHSVYFICSDHQGKQAGGSEFTDKIEIVTRKKISKFGRWFRVLLGSAPSVAKFSSSEMQARVRELIAYHDFDAILLYDLSSIQYCPESAYKKAIVNVEDPQSIRLSRLSKLSIGSPLQRITWSAHAMLTKRYENAVLPKFAKVLTLSKADMGDMQRQGGYQNLGHVSYGVDFRPDADIVSCEDRTKGMIIFSGNMFHPTNVDGILFFLTRIFPAVLKEYSSATLWIVGAEPDPRIRDAAMKFGDQIVITGKVKDVSQYLRRAKVSICPIQLKIGVQTKILEALSWATPVVTTSAGNSGVGARSGNDLWIEDEPMEFAQRVVALLHDDNWTQLSEKGRKFVVKHFSWERSVLELERHIEFIRALN